jgi:predicted dehydrogenase
MEGNSMIRMAIVGTGGMAGGHADNYRKISGVRLVAACDVDEAKATQFAKRFGIPEGAVFTSIDTLLKSVEFDAVSVVTSDAGHAPISLKCIAAGKHVLCEKPLATNYADAKKMADAAARRGVINMVNLSYRNSSAIHRAAQLVKKGALGRIMHVDANYRQSWLSSKVWGDWRSSDGWLWRLSTKHGSKGVLGDIGVHILDFASYAAGDIASVNCLLKTFHKAKGDKVGKYPLDANDSAVITVELANGAIGTIHTSRWQTGYANALELHVHGDKGAIRIFLDRSYTELEICKGADVDRCAWKTVTCGNTPNMYQRFIRSIKSGKNDQPDFARGAAVQKAIDACFESDRRGTTVKV